MPAAVSRGGVWGRCACGSDMVRVWGLWLGCLVPAAVASRGQEAGVGGMANALHLQQREGRGGWQGAGVGSVCLVAAGDVVCE